MLNETFSLIFKHRDVKFYLPRLRLQLDTRSSHLPGALRSRDKDMILFWNTVEM